MTLLGPCLFEATFIEKEQHSSGSKRRFFIINPPTQKVDLSKALARAVSCSYIISSLTDTTGNSMFLPLRKV